MYTQEKPYTWLEISTSALNHNLVQLKKVIGADHILAPVIKANAYGHGFLHIAQLCDNHPAADWLCMALLSDALQARHAGIKKPILIIGYIDADPADAINQNIDLYLTDEQTAQKLNALGKKYNYRFGVHVKIDTGLSRLGVLPTQAINFVQKINSLPFLKINGIYSHFVEAQKEETEFTLGQLATFNTIISTLANQGINPQFIHIANSAGTLQFSPVPGNFCRVGVGIFGLWPSPYVKKMAQVHHPDLSFKPVMSWKTCIMHVKQVTAGSFIGYNRTYQAPHDALLAIMPIGYFDGYDLRFSNQAHVKIHGQYAPIVGRICMNHSIIDVSKIDNVQVGDEVLVLGDDPRVNAYACAQLTGYNNVREILTKIYPHIPRILVA